MATPPPRTWQRGERNLLISVLLIKGGIKISPFFLFWFDKWEICVIERGRDFRFNVFSTIGWFSVVNLNEEKSSLRYFKEFHRSISGPPLTPKFGQDNLDNHTVRVGNEVQFSCTVENLGNYKVAWLHSEKGTLAVYPIVVTQNDRMSVSFDNRATYNLKLQNIQESDAGKYICQINTGPVISISGTLSVVGKNWTWMWRFFVPANWPTCLESGRKRSFATKHPSEFWWMAGLHLVTARTEIPVKTRVGCFPDLWKPWRASFRLFLKFLDQFNVFSGGQAHSHFPSWTLVVFLKWWRVFSGLPVPPDIIDEDSSSDTLATEGMRVLLNCRARGNPTPTISWVREDGSKIRVCKSDNSVFERRTSECEEGE